MRRATSLMNTHALARRLLDLNWWLEGQEELATERLEFERAPQGRARVALDPWSNAAAASMNRNRICLCGNEGGLTKDGLAALAELFAARGIARFFVWLSPGPAGDEVREWLLSMSFTRVKWTRYPTLLLAEPPLPPRRSPFEIRRTSAEEIAAARGALGEALMDGYVRTLGKPGLFHYLALDDGRPIAVAALAHFQDLGYLTYAGTVESARRRGAQSALIAHRVAAARALGCKMIVSQTLTMLEDSFANLERAGFREVFEQEAYESPA